LYFKTAALPSARAGGETVKFSNKPLRIIPTRPQKRGLVESPESAGSR
jgi:hypothetical protein